MSWLALTGIQLGDSIYRFPYFIILGHVLVINPGPMDMPMVNRDIAHYVRTLG